MIKNLQRVDACEEGKTKDKKREGVSAIIQEPESCLAGVGLIFFVLKSCG